MKEIKTNDGKKGGWLVGKRHYDKSGKSLGGIKAIVTDAGGKPVELEGGEVIINREASKKYWKELSRINQSAGNGVAIGPPSGFDEDPEDNYENGGKIDFNPNHIPNKWILSYAEKIKANHPEIWKLGGNIFGNEAFKNLKRVADRGHWLDSEEWMYIKWRAYVARHQRDYRIEGVVAMLKWVDKVEKGWPYMKQLIEEKINKIESKKKGWKHKMKTGGDLKTYSVKKELGKIIVYKNGERYGYVFTRKEWDSKKKKDNPIVCLKRYSDNKIFTSNYAFQQDAFKYIKDTGELFFDENQFKEGGSVNNTSKSFVIFLKSNLLNNIIYTNIDSDSLENAIKEQKLLYSWSDIAWIKGFETNSANYLQEFFLQNIKQKWETKPELTVSIKNGKIVFKRNEDSVSFYFTPVFEVKDGVKIFKEGYLQHSTTEIDIDSDFNFDRNKIFELMLRKMKDGGSVAQTPAPKKDQIKGSDVNKSGSSATTKGASSIKFDEKTIESINNKVKEHNDAHPNKKITLASAKAVVRRGMGAYSSSHRPTITGGQPNSRVAWGIARLNAFTYKIVHGKSKSGKYTQDDDLINELGYSVSKMKHGGELAMGIKAEHEHSHTIDKFKRKGVSDLDIETAIAKDHLKEDPHYYSKLAKMEGKKYAGGGLVDAKGQDVNVLDYGYYDGRTKENVTVNKITDKLVYFTNDQGKYKNADRSNFSKYFINKNIQKTTQPVVLPATKSLSIDDKIKEAIKKFTATRLVKDLPSGLLSRVYANQIAQGNKQESNIELDKTKGRGNFNWDESPEGEGFWHNIVLEDWTNKDVLSIMGSKEAFFEAPSKPTTIDLTNTKIRINSPEESKLFQEFAIKKGAKWPDGNEVSYTSKPYLFLDRFLNFAYADLESTFDAENNKEITLEDLGLKPSSEATEIIVQQKEIQTHKHQDESEIRSERDLLIDEYNDITFLISITPSTDVDNMLALKQQSKELKDKLDVLDLELKKKIDGEINLLENLFKSSTVKPQERYQFKPYNDGFAPDGQPTELPKNLYDWTMTEEFINWFGNFTIAYNYKNSGYLNTPCSVVVNKNYEPLIVYHGTGSEFSFFKFDKFPAMYFAENVDYSNWFAEIKGREIGTNGYIYPFFLNIRTPLDLTHFKIDDISPQDFIDWMFLQTGLDEDELKINKALLNPNGKHKAWMFLRNSPEMLQVLRDKNVCDGVIYYEDNPSVDKTSSAYQTKAYIVFNSNSAKIADPSRDKLTVSAMRSFYLKKGGKV